MTRQICCSHLNKYVIGLLIVSICLLTAASAQAVSLYWNQPGGGAGTWDTASTTWATVAGGSNDTVWSNAAGNDAVFQNTGGAVAVDLGGITVHNIDFNVTGYDLSNSLGGIITLAGTTPVITVANASTSASISADMLVNSSFTVGGSGDLTLGNTSSASAKTLTKSGAGILNLGGGLDNAFIDLNLTQGTAILNKTSASNIHAVNNVTGVSSGATLQLGTVGLGGDQIAGSVTGMNGIFDLNGQSETIGQLSGTGSVTNNLATTTSTLTVGGSTLGSSFAGTIQDGA